MIDFLKVEILSQTQSLSNLVVLSSRSSLLTDSGIPTISIESPLEYCLEAGFALQVDNSFGVSSGRRDTNLRFEIIAFHCEGFEVLFTSFRLAKILTM